MKQGLVLGGGGLVGMGYHAGTLKALDELGLNPAGADVIVGTSAGAILGAYLCAGWTPHDFYDYAYGRHRDAVAGDAPQRQEVARLFQPLYSNHVDRARRMVGGLVAAASSRGYLARAPVVRPPVGALHRLFPSGMYSTEETRDRFRRDLPKEWPARDIFVSTVELHSGARVAFGRKGAPRASFPDAVLASTAIPGVFPPVEIAGRQYVDGGVASATSLDLAVDEGCDTILCIAPLGYRTDEAVLARDPRMWGPMLVRGLFARALKREVAAARALGVEVLVIRPWLTELKQHGTNSMRHHDRTAVVEAARAGTIRLMEENMDHPVVRAFQAIDAQAQGSG
jgi:NTE family protein